MNDENILDHFRKHCELGFSPRSFSGKLLEGVRGYEELIRTNIDFVLLHEKFTVRVRSSIYNAALSKNN